MHLCLSPQFWGREEERRKEEEGKRTINDQGIICMYQLPRINTLFCIASIPFKKSSDFVSASLGLNIYVIYVISDNFLRVSFFVLGISQVW